MLNRLEVKQAMDSRGLKASWVADKVGIKPDTLRQFLTGKKNLGTPAQILLAQLLELRINRAS